MPRPRVAILIGPKGRGSNMLALAASCHDGRVPADLAVVVSPKPETPAVLAALELGIEIEVVDPESAVDYGAALLDVLHRRRADWICLAGYLRLLPKAVLAAYPGRILNVHPALLPKFGGKGMYGRHVHEAVMAAGETESGCTVHFVTENYDEGPPILQLKCPVEPDDTPDTLALRVLKLEHSAFSEALAMAVRGEAKP